MPIGPLSRRAFLRGAGSGLVIALAPALGPRPARAEEPALGGWIRVAPDGSVDLALDKAEMGQGVFTALGAIVAEELGVAWERVRVETRALTGPERSFSTGASTSVRHAGPVAARAAAAAREMLVAVGARRLGADPSRCDTEDGAVVDRVTGRRVGFPALIEEAATLPVPEAPALRAPDQRRLLGRPLPRVDTPAKVDGRAVFGIDVVRPGMLRAAVAMAPAAGGRVVSFDAVAARAEPGVVAALELTPPAPVGVAVVAEQFWQAERGLARAKVRFEADPEPFASDAYREALLAALRRDGVTVEARGEPEAALAGAADRHQARYEVPFLAHVAMEPQNCTAEVRGGRCEIWAPTQSAGRMRYAVAAMLGIAIERIEVHTTYLGGGFGRRYEPDVALQAVQLASALGRPVQVLWSREQDVRHDFYRPAFAALLRAGLDAGGRPRAWHQRIAGPWYEARAASAGLQRAVAWLERQLGPPLVPRGLPDALEYRFPPWMRSGPSALAVHGAGPSPYAIADARVEYALVPAPAPVGYWRSVGHSQNAFFVESFLDELAHRAGADPVRYRADLLSGAARMKRVLERAARRARWDDALPAGRARGVALHPSFGSYVAQIAEVEVGGDGGPRVVRVVCAVDCGEIVNPDGVVAQVEGGIAYGLSTLRQEITFQGGAVEQGNFDDFPILSADEMPEVEVELVRSDAAAGGVGEIATPPIVPAVTNAWFAATGERVRRLPFPAPGSGGDSASSAGGGAVRRGPRGRAPARRPSPAPAPRWPGT